MTAKKIQMHKVMKLWALLEAAEHIISDMNSETFELIMKQCDETRTWKYPSPYYLRRIIKNER